MLFCKDDDRREDYPEQKYDLLDFIIGYKGDTRLCYAIDILKRSLNQFFKDRQHWIALFNMVKNYQNYIENLNQYLTGLIRPTRLHQSFVQGAAGFS